MGLAALGSIAVIGGLIGAKAVPWAAAPDTQPTATTTPGATVGPSGAPSGTPSPRTSSSSAPSSPLPSSGAPSSTDGTYTGDSAATRYGDVQVEIDVSSGHIADIRVVKSPNRDRTCVAISQRAVPVLIADGLAAQSANIHVVSGATYTSKGYQKSLQSAIDKAGI